MYLDIFCRGDYVEMNGCPVVFNEKAKKFVNKGRKYFIGLMARVFYLSKDFQYLGYHFHVQYNKGKVFCLNIIASPV